MRRFPVLFTLLAAAACGEVPPADDATVTQQEGSLAGQGRAARAALDVPLKVLIARRGEQRPQPLPADILRTRHELRGRKQVEVVDVHLELETRALSALRALDVVVRTLTSEGTATATVPVDALDALASVDGVSRIEAARPVKKANDTSQGLVFVPSGAAVGMNNPTAAGGAGVVVGIVDSGIDWTHLDFIEDASEGAGPLTTRIRYYWDQSDTGDLAAPTDAGFTYGHEYDAADINAALATGDNTWDPATGWFGPVNSPSYPIRAAARDMDGHGTHVTGSAAGDGSGSGYPGGAPEADLVIVKFDFDGARNTDAATVDAVNYIFKRAAALGKPAVINMSLGSDYHSHDGKTLQERSLSALAGAGKVVMVAAGNPGANNWSPALAWGFALHGKGVINSESVTFRFPTYTATTSDYVFFDVWYPKGNNCKVKITTPTGKVYPPTGTAYKNSWNTNTAYQGFSSTDGGMLVQNGGDPFGSGNNSGDINAYIEISDYYGTNPRTGTWTIQLVPATSTAICAGTYHAWYGVSSNMVQAFRAEAVRNPTPRFGGRESDNAVTIGNPASADGVIAVAAYASRLSWNFAYGSECAPESTGTAAYGSGALAYYDPFELGELAAFSGRGPRRDDVLKPEISAPGVGIASSLSHFVRDAQWESRCVAYSAGGGYHFGTDRVLPGTEGGMLQGTSMATPNATGGVAVLLSQKGDLDAACLRELWKTTARHDVKTDTYQKASFTTGSDTDTAAAPGAANADWGYGKLDITATAGALPAWPACAVGGCKVTADCGSGKTCQAPTHPCGCGTCVAAPTCQALGTVCTTATQCCSGVCTGKKTKTCK